MNPDITFKLSAIYGVSLGGKNEGISMKKGKWEVFEIKLNMIISRLA